MLKLNKQYHVLPQGNFRGKRGVIMVLFIIIVSLQLYLGRIDDEGFWEKYWFLILFVPYIIYQIWIEEETDKLEDEKE